MTPLPRSTPEAEGIPSSAILDFIGAADAQLHHLHSMMVVRHGRVVAEGWWHPYAAQHPHMMFSISKSFTSTAVGLALAEGRLTLDDLVVDLLPDDLPGEISPHLAALRVRHLLTMTTGHAADTVSLAEESHGENWARAILAQPLDFAPGTHYLYNSGASYLLSAILQRLTGLRLLDYLTPRLFAPLGIVDATWESCPRGIDAGGWGLSITTEDLATFGQFLLQRGEWNGTQLVPATWVDEATSAHADNSRADHSLDGRQGYGYQFWRNRPTGYRADGAFGQFCLVLPEQDAVVVLTSGLPDAQIALDLVWEHLLPAFGEEPLPGSADVLGPTLSRLALPPVEGEPTSPTAERFSGIRLALDGPDVTAVSLEANRLTVERNGSEEMLSFGHGEWLDSPSQRVAASGAWVAPDRFVARAVHYETPYSVTFELGFDADLVTLDITQNVSFGQTRLAHAVGGV
jgi:CubicO group peptidase (beta-lactamase class C family)